MKIPRFTNKALLLIMAFAAPITAAAFVLSASPERVKGVRTRFSTSAIGALILLAFTVAMLLAPLANVHAAEPRSAEVLALLEELPMWPMRPFIADDREQERRDAAAALEAAVAKLDKYDLDEIRGGLVLYKKSPAYRPELAFVVLQYLFEIPRRDDPLFRHVRPSHVVFGPSSKDLPESWPWKKREDKSLQFEVLTIGLMRNGPPYPAVEVFDSYRKHFPRRNSE